jgi:glutamate N-acetyltransferase / amino-acid N-acetyltransferase
MTLPLGYRYATLYAGIRKTRKADLTLVVSDPIAAAAAMFTTNRVQAAPVVLDREHLKASRGAVRALLINAGNANCATRTGAKVALATSRALARALGSPVEQVLPSSTGVIGVEMDGSKITRAIPALIKGLREDRFLDAADAICTTDTRPKVAYAEHNGIRIAGFTKGAGMIQPNMATTLGYVFTDAKLSAPDLRKLLVACVETSYHRITVDGDTSTNDTVMLLANGASGRRPEPGFAEAVAGVFESLARQIAQDGEGARRLVQIDVEGASDTQAAVRIGRAIANSPLVKTAVAGADPNWGRIISAAGYAGVAFDPAETSVWLQGVRVCRNGLAARYHEESLAAKLKADEVSIRIQVGAGSGEARFWTCDFTEGYIRINGSYRT